MALTGGKVVNPRNGATVSWRPARPTADNWAFVMNNRARGYRQLGVIGNPAHLKARTPGDHTPFSKHCIEMGGKNRCPLPGWVYADDSIVPESARFESWFLGRLRAGAYPHVKYFNINNRHWHRSNMRNGVPFAWAVYSGDAHLHQSQMPGAEYTKSTVFPDWEVFRATGKNPATAKPKPTPAPSVHPAKVAANRLPTLSKGSRGGATLILQAALTAARHATAIDGVFGDDSVLRVRAFQRAAKLTVDGVCGPKTWDALLPDKPPQVIRGVESDSVRLLQALLTAHGWRTTIDGRMGDQAVANLKKFQKAAAVPNSVIKGTGDGICGPATWGALLTP